jgi:hypothetical protein
MNINQDDAEIVALVQELQSWPGPHINSHKSASQFFHKLVFLADIGLKHDYPGIGSIVEKILETMDENGVPCLSMEIPAGYGGTGETEKAWALCDAPNILYALKLFGIDNEKADNAVRYLATQIRENGFGCVVSPSLKHWRGPGKKTDPCPYATLAMLKLLILYGDIYRREIAICAETLLELWKNSREQHPYIFYMGNDFRKLKLPFIWYDILHVVHVISQVESFAGDPRLLEMFKVIKDKEKGGGFTPESVYQPWKAWDFGQKNHPSAWMTYWVGKIENQLRGLHGQGHDSDGNPANQANESANHTFHASSTDDIC